MARCSPWARAATPASGTDDCGEQSRPSQRTVNEAALVESIAISLRHEFGEVMSPAELRAIAAVAVEKYSAATVRNYVPILAHRASVQEATRQQQVATERHAT
jgi:hypothetical protein